MFTVPTLGLDDYGTGRSGQFRRLMLPISDQVAARALA